MTRLAYSFALLLLLAALSAPDLRAQDDPEEPDVYEQEYVEADTTGMDSLWTLDPEFRMGPPFGQGTSS